MLSVEKPTRSRAYEASYHCGNIKFSLKLSPPPEEGYEVLNCNCSICRRSGYLLIYPNNMDITWHGESRKKCTNYRFDTKTKDQMFCGSCGSSLGIDFLEEDYYGISARALDGIDLETLTYKKLDGLNRVSPAQDLSGEESKGRQCVDDSAKSNVPTWNLNGEQKPARCIQTLTLRNPLSGAL